MKHIHIMHYLVLGIIVFGGTVAFYYAAPNTALQLTVGVITSLAYIAWGLIHHYLKKSLHKRIVVEYILMGAIAIIMLATVLLGS
jgi:hypothetical protein